MFALLRTVTAASAKPGVKRPSVRSTTSSSVRDLFVPPHDGVTSDGDAPRATASPTETDASTVSSDSSERGGRIAAARAPPSLNTHSSPAATVAAPAPLPPPRIRAPSLTERMPLGPMSPTEGASPSVSSLLCPICRDILTAPVRACPCHAFCRSCISTWSATQGRDGAVATCPVCRVELPPIASLRVDALLAARVKDATRVAPAVGSGALPHSRTRARVDSRGESGIVGVMSTAAGTASSGAALTHGRTPRVSFNHIQTRGLNSIPPPRMHTPTRPRMAVPSMGTPVSVDAAVETIGGGRARACSSPMKRAALTRYRSRSRTASVIAPVVAIGGDAPGSATASVPEASPSASCDSESLDPLARTPWPMPAFALGPPALQSDETGVTVCLMETADGEVVAAPAAEAGPVAYIARIRALSHDEHETTRFGLRMCLSRLPPGGDGDWDDNTADDVLTRVTPHMSTEDVLVVLRNGVIAHAVDVLCVQSRPCEARALRAAVAIHCVSEHAVAAPFLCSGGILSSLVGAPLNHHTHRIATVSCCTSIANVLAHAERAAAEPGSTPLLVALGREAVTHMLSKLAYTLTCIMGDAVCVCACVAALTHVAALADTDTLCECMGIAVSALCECVHTHMHVKDVALACVGLMKRLAVSVDLPKETAEGFLRSLASTLDAHTHDTDLCVAVCEYVVMYADTRSRARVCARAGVHTAIARSAGPSHGGSGATHQRVQAAARAALAKVQDGGCVTQ